MSPSLADVVARPIAALALAGLAAAAPVRPSATRGDAARSRLAVREGGRWVEWWRSDRAPSRWTAPDPVLARAIHWSTLAPGLEVGEAELSGSGEAWRTRLVVARLDARRFRLRLQLALADPTRGAWTVDSAPSDAMLALNTGQFAGAVPWGWLVVDGEENEAPRSGPLSTAIVVDTAGTVRLVDADSIAAVRAAGIAAQAFQSYPALLVGDGDLPPALAPASRAIDVGHRDGRLAIGLLRDGRVVVALTRFDALGGALSAAPLGLTVPELAALMGALGCRRAVALDGGISSQLLLRDAAGGERAWRGWRRVPLGLVAEPERAAPAPVRGAGR